MPEKFPPLIQLGPFEGVNTSVNDLLAQDGEASAAPSSDPFRVRGALSTARGRAQVGATGGGVNPNGWLICSGANATLKQAGAISALAASPTTTLPMTPTAGTLLVVEILLGPTTNPFQAGPTLTPNAGWTMGGFYTGGTNPNAAIAWKITSGETATLSPISNFGGTDCNYATKAYEFIGFNATTPVLVTAGIGTWYAGSGGNNLTLPVMYPLAGSLGFQGGAAFYLVGPPGFNIPYPVVGTAGFSAWNVGPFYSTNPPYNQYEVFTSSSLGVVTAAQSAAGITGIVTLGTSLPVNCDTFMSQMLWFVQPGLSGC